MNADTEIGKRLSKSGFERLRIPLSIGVVTVWTAFLLTTQARGFETVGYDLLEQAGFFLIFVAVLGRLWCTLYIGGRKNRELCRSGPYSLCRNPLYFFSFSGVVGVGLAAQNVILTAITALIFLAYYRVIIGKEEVRLQSMFGASFADYVAQVPRFWPRWQVPETESVVEVNVHTFVRTLKDAAWFLLAIIAIEIIEDLRTRGTLVGWILPY